MRTSGTRSVSLDEIRKPVAQELRSFDQFFREAMQSDVALVDLIARYIVRQKGKRVRPILVLLSARTCGDIGENTYRGAALVEILHTATLVHDDVVDDADTRRGFPSINAVWKNKVAVLMGDYLLSRGLLLAIEHGEHAFLRSTTRAVKRMSEGELLQIQKTRKLNSDEPTYLRIIADKTASLFATCTEIGALSATADADRHAALRSYGEAVGMAFQIRDDLLDYVGRRGVLGKPTGTDLREKKLTLPLIAALRQSSGPEAARALALVRNGARRKDVTWLIDFVERNGGILYATEKAGAFADVARSHLASLPSTPARQALLDFVQFVIERDR